MNKKRKKLLHSKKKKLKSFIKKNLRTKSIEIMYFKIKRNIERKTFNINKE